MAQALIIVDVQNDFVAPDGALAVTGAPALLPRINELAADPRFDVVIATRDRHPADHSSFAAQGGPWPPHCVDGTPGVELVDALDREHVDAVIDKGREVDGDGYSAFENPELGALLREEAVTAVTVVGVAADFCVLNTARDALAEGFVVAIDPSAVAGVDPAGAERALDELRGLGAIVPTPSGQPD